MGRKQVDLQRLDFDIHDLRVHIDKWLEIIPILRSLFVEIFKTDLK